MRTSSRSLRVEPDPVELLGGGVVEVGHRPGEAGGVAVEVEPDRDLGGVGHAVDVVVMVTR